MRIHTWSGYWSAAQIPYTNLTILRIKKYKEDMSLPMDVSTGSLLCPSFNFYYTAARQT